METIKKCSKCYHGQVCGYKSYINDIYGINSMTENLFEISLKCKSYEECEESESESENSDSI